MRRYGIVICKDSELQAIVLGSVDVAVKEMERLQGVQKEVASRMEARGLRVKKDHFWHYRYAPIVSKEK